VQSDGAPEAFGGAGNKRDPATQGFLLIRWR
jgi:hypothetical protein